MYIELYTGASIPSEAMMHVPPMFQISPPVSEKLSDSVENFPVLPFPEKFSDFHPPKFHIFLVINHKFRISLQYPLSIHFTPLFQQNYSFHLYFSKFPLFSENLRIFYMLSLLFVSPYFYHDAFMHLTMNVAYWTPLIIHIAHHVVRYIIYICIYMYRGVHPPETVMHFPPLFQISPYLRKIFGLSEIFLQFYLFPKNFLTFIR